MAKRKTQTTLGLKLAIENAIEVCDDAARARNGQKLFENLLDQVSSSHGEQAALAWGLILSGIAFNQYFLGQINEDEFQSIRNKLQPITSSLLLNTKPAEGKG